VISKSLFWNRAIPAVMVGVAFFFTSCKPKIPPREELRVEKPAAVAIHRMAEAYLKTEQYGKALVILKRISNNHPNYEDLSTVQYQIANCLYLLGQYRSSKNNALKWLEQYPQDSLKADILILLGKDFNALGDKPQAFYWWLKAKEEYPDNILRQEELNKELDELVRTSKIEELERISEYAAESDYAPKIYHRIATFFVDQNELEKAQKAAMSLVQSTTENSWILVGRQLLERIQGEMAVRPNVVGCLLPLSGPFAIYGEEILNGIQLGMATLGEKWQDSDLELVIKDTKGTPEDTLAGLENLVINEKVMAIIGPLLSITAIAAAKKAQRLGVPIITLTQKEGIMEEGDMVFRNFLTPSQEVKRLLNTAIYEMGIKRFGVLYPDNSYGRFFMNLFWDRLEEMGAKVTAIESYNPDDTDFANPIKKMTGLYYPRPASLIQKLIEMRSIEEEENEIFPEEPEPIIDFDAVFVPDNFQRVAMIAPQLAYHDVLDVLLMGTSLWQSPQLIELAKDYVQGAIFSSGFFKRSGYPRVKDFVESYRVNFDSDPGLLAASGYDTIRMLKKVLAGDEIRTRRDVQMALLKCHDFKGVAGEITFDTQGEVKKEPLLLTISRNQMILFH